MSCSAAEGCRGENATAAIFEFVARMRGSGQDRSLLSVGSRMSQSLQVCKKLDTMRRVPKQVEREAGAVTARDLKLHLGKASAQSAGDLPGQDRPLRCAAPRRAQSGAASRG